METNCHENGPRNWKNRRKKAGVPLGRAGLGVPQQRSRLCHLFPAQVGSLLLKDLSGYAPRGSLGFGFLFSIKGLDSQQKLNIKAATECCVSFGSFTRPPTWPLPILGTHIIFILSRVAGAANFRFNWQKTL